MSELGPLAPFEGNWEGNVGVDLAFDHDAKKILETPYFEKARFSRIPIVNNGTQTMHGLNYEMTAWRHGEEDGDPFHDEVGYLLWEEATGQVMRCFAVPRGIAILAGCDSTPTARSFDFVATPGAVDYGLIQNKYLLQGAHITAFTSNFTLGDDGTFSYDSDLTITIEAYGGEMHHTDKNTLHKVD